jgi:hypothetical protein
MKIFNIILLYALLTISLYSQEVELIIHYSTSSEKKSVNIDIKELSFIKTAIIGIDGLEQLKSLESITFDKTPFLLDYSFLKNVPWIKKIVLLYGPNINDWTFIQELPNLEILYIDGYNRGTIKLDLRNNISLEYLALCNGSLEFFPELNNIPKSLKYINLTVNKINNLPCNFSRFNDIKIFIKLNLLNETSYYTNLIFDWAENNLPKKFIIPY